jgi:hypothetical protein
MLTTRSLSLIMYHTKSLLPIFHHFKPMNNLKAKSSTGFVTTILQKKPGKSNKCQ